VIRLCANTGARLHLVKPLGFTLEDAQLRRAGLDYHEYASLQVHDTLDAALAAIADAEGAAPRVFALSTRGTTRFDTVAYRPGDAFLFGPETRGLPGEVLARLADEVTGLLGRLLGHLLDVLGGRLRDLAGRLATLRDRLGRLVLHRRVQRRVRVGRLRLVLQRRIGVLIAGHRSSGNDTSSARRGPAGALAAQLERIWMGRGAWVRRDAIAATGRTGALTTPSPRRYPAIRPR